MSQAFIFRKDCWIYTTKKERDNMKQIIMAVKERGSCCMNHFKKALKTSPSSVRLAVFYLVGAKILNVQQRREVRVFKLNNRWEERLKECLSATNKKEDYNRQPAIQE